MGVKWHGDEAKRLIRAAFARNLAAAAIVVKSRAKVLLSVPGTANREAPGRDKGGRFTKAKIYGADRSKPGEPPRKQYGRLRGSVAHEVDAGSLTARVGTNLLYGRWLELGTSRMAARPWLRRALAESRDKIRSILARRPPGL